MSIEERFKKDVLARLSRAEAAIPGYSFTRMRSLIDKNGAVATAKSLLDLSKLTDIQYGLEALAENDLLDCSIEQAAIDFENSGEFTAAEVAIAKSRLLIASKKR
jgi:hypothetical protein